MHIPATSEAVLPSRSARQRDAVCAVYTLDSCCGPPSGGRAQAGWEAEGEVAKMVAVPVLKLFTLTVKTLAKPMSKRIKTGETSTKVPSSPAFEYRSGRRFRRCSSRAPCRVAAVHCSFLPALAGTPPAVEERSRGCQYLVNLSHRISTCCPTCFSVAECCHGQNVKSMVASTSTSGLVRAGWGAKALAD